MGRDKALMPWNDEFTLLEWAVERLEKVCENVVILSSNPNHEHPRADWVPDYIDAQGPMAGIYPALMSSESDWNIVLACDLPHVTSEALGTLGVIATTSDAALGLEAIVYQDENGLQPLCGIYHRSVVKKMAFAIENKNFRMMDLLQQLNFTTIQVPEDQPNMLANMNSPSDLPTAHHESVRVKVLLFASLQEKAGFAEKETSFRDLTDVRAWLIDLLPEAEKLPYIVAVNQEIVRGNRALQNGDEIALMPPFAGG